jgi:hypothetical protein
MLAVLIGAVAPFVHFGVGHARQEVMLAHSARGGTLAGTAHYRFEVFFYSTGVRVFVTDAAGDAFNASTLTGTATFYHPNSPQPWFARPLRPAPAQPGQPAESLDLAVDLAAVPAPGATVTVEVRGLPDPEESTARFTMPFAPVVTAGAGPPRSSQAMAPSQTYPAASEPVHYFPLVGFYQTTSGVVIWVPAPGYYYGTSVQYFGHSKASGWQYAHPGPVPDHVANAPGWAGAPGSIHADLYWRPRAMGDTESYEAWLRGEMRRQEMAGRSPKLMGGECAKCHR